MKVIEIGHTYALQNKIFGEQIVKFFKDLPSNDPLNHDGVLGQEVFRMLLDRYRELQNQKPCYETMQIIIGLERCLVLNETRAFRLSLEKSYAKTGKFVDQLPIQANGHIYDPLS